MMGSEFVEVKETPEEVRRWQAKAANEVSGKDHHFA
jgi:hypothetical protein